MASGRRSAIRLGFGTTLHARSSLFDAGLIVAVPFVLIAVFTLPAGVRESYALEYTDPTLVTMYASHFVHLNVQHLAANLAGYAFLVPTAYLLCLLGDRRRTFRVAFPAFLLALPFGLSGLNLVFFRQAVAYGFSGVVMGYFGLLTLSLFGYAESRTNLAGGDRHAPVAFFVGIAAIAGALAPASRASAAVAAASLLLCGLYARTLLDLGVPLARFRSGLAESPPGYLELGAVGTLLFFGYPFIAFPADPFQGGTVVNLYTHLLGYALGFISVYTFRMTA
ncbi:hypothetical protein [Natronomonas marina]|jgi:hypothetical protein|uniref:hypothetical protein n=1 Tax=Natronomonas marina TaxID=2961939 RepID=UPI0020C98253|nr:hypothetical protein [Natronomonas marina]